MRISQPINCEVTTIILNRLPGQVEVSVALWHVFSLEAGKPDPEDSRVIWALSKKHGAKLLDEGYPKPRGEFLCFGTAYPPAEQRSGPFEAAVRVNDQMRRLAVFGRREFSMLGGPHEAGGGLKPIAISPQNAFGGKDFVENPDGLGWKAITGDMAPYVDDPDNLIKSPDHAVAPAGFWPLTPAASVRRKHLGTFNETWLKTHWPSFPSDTALEFFQVAPEKQRMSSHFKGGEVCEIINMNEACASLQFRIPQTRARCVYRRGSDTGLFHGWRESPIKAETLYLFPNEQVGAMLHRCIVQVSRADAMDLQDVLLTLEPAGSYQPAQAIIKNLYQSQLLDVITPTDETKQVMPNSEKAAMPSIPNMSETSLNPTLSASQPIRRTTQSGLVKLAPDFEYVLTQTGLKQETIEAIRRAPDPFAALGSALKAQIQQARQEFEDAVKQSGLTEQAYLEALKQHPQVGAAMQKSGLSAGLSVQIGAMAEFVDTMIDMLRSTSTESFAASFGNSSLTSTVTETVAQQIQTTSAQSQTQASAEMQALVEERRNSPTQFAGMNLSGLCLAGLSLIGLDFSEAICQETDFTGCDLSHAKLNQATLTSAKLANAKMTGADLSGVIASNATFNAADLSEANLSGATLNNCACQSTRFDKATLEQTQLDQSDLSGANFKSANLTKTSACECLFEDCDFSGATLDQTDFMKSALTNCRFEKTVGKRTDFSGAKVTKGQFLACQLKDCSAMLKASIDSCEFRDCDLQGLNWVTALLSGVIFDACDLSASDFSSGELAQTIFNKSKLQNVSFFSSRLNSVTLLKNNLMEASFHGAKLNECSVLGNNLFGADFIETEFDEKTTLEGNVMLKTILAQRGHP